MQLNLCRFKVLMKMYVTNNFDSTLTNLSFTIKHKEC